MINVPEVQGVASGKWQAASGKWKVTVATEIHGKHGNCFAGYAWEMSPSGDDCYDKQVTKLQSQQTMGKAGPKKGANGALNRKNTQARSNNNKLRVFSRKM